MKAFFISKRTNSVVDSVLYAIDGGCTPMAEFYTVLSEKEFPIGSVVDLSPLRKKYPDEIIRGTNDDGTPYESTIYGKYSENGLCVEPWEVI